ncbi:MAG TPA: tRNA (adenosine(37)-N6)-threonylcarbamoyltransferase complex ATPase subunit type 1 TsaE [Lentimicrobium sp.]|nr:tRNA (adenosine(37)-N6)-threonylcarbamoyltransferase complex ATPase subunit type 1 TsaE [Lentimicrobium sp.]
MTETVFHCNKISELETIAEQILLLYPDEKIFLISGKMGAGKTTLIKSMCQALNVVDVVNSPTFSIVNEYTTLQGSSIYHFDLYRIKSPAELLDIGYEEYIYSGSYCLIEWPELTTKLMPSSFVMVKIDVEELSEMRSFTVNLEYN